MKNVAAVITLLILLFGCTSSNDLSEQETNEVMEEVAETVNEKVREEAEVELVEKSEVPDTGDDVIQNIKAQFATITSGLDSYNIDSFNVECNHWFVSIKKYSEGEQMKYVLKETYDDHGGSTEHYYYDQGKLFFVFTEELYLMESGNITHHRYYLNDGNLLKHLQKDVYLEQVGYDALKKAVAREPNKEVELNEAALKQVLSDGKVMQGISADNVKTEICGE